MELFEVACLAYNFFYITIELWDRHKRKEPVSFLEVFMYIEDKFADMKKVVEIEETQTRKKIADSFFNSEERSVEKLKIEIQKLRDEHKNGKS